jgi:hypothetical protein
MSEQKKKRRAERQKLQADIMAALRTSKHYSKAKAKHYARCTVDYIFSQQ